MSLDHGPYYGEDWHNPPQRPPNPAAALRDLWYCHTCKVYYSDTLNMQQLHADHFTLEPTELLTQSAPMGDELLDDTYNNLVAYERHCEKQMADIQMKLAGQLEVVHYHNNGLRSGPEHAQATATLNDMIVLARSYKRELAVAKEAIRQYHIEHTPNWELTTNNPNDRKAD